MENNDEVIFRPREFLRKHWIKFVFIFLIMGAHWFNIKGVTVPTSEPYVKFEIVTERETYYVGEVAQAKFLIRNMMPFPIRIVITEDIEIRRRYANETKAAISHQYFSEDKPLDVRIGIGHAYGENRYSGLHTSRSGEIVFEFYVAGNNITHSVNIVE